MSKDPVDRRDPSKDGLSRRDFLADGSKLALGFSLVPRHVLGGPRHRPPSDTLNVAVVGAGGMGGENAQELGSENIVAVCDVDMGHVARKVETRTTDADGNPREKGLRWKEQFERAARYTDFRRMLEEADDIDAVLVATPDHVHAHVAAAAMAEGKHVYVQKPLAWSVEEARILDLLATETGVVTQMGNQGHSGDDGRRILEWVDAGIPGPVDEVHVWTNRPIWPQGLPAPVRPREMPREDDWWPGAVGRRIADALDRGYVKPAGLDWDLYGGPIVREVPYHPIYHPFHWRGWTAFGVGALGDMGAHLLDHAYWALDLGYPETVEATSTPWGGPAEDPVCYPLAMTVHYRFPARGDRPPVDLHWYDGGLMPARPDALPEDVELEREGGAIFVGDRGVLVHETYGRNPAVYPAALQEEADAVPESHPRIEESHEMNWALACKGEAEASSPFSYAAPLTEVMLLGIVALRAGQGRKIRYDAESMTITNVPEANAHLVRDYREGWSL